MPAAMMALAPGEVEMQLAVQQADDDDSSELAMVNRREPVDALALRLLAMTAVCAVATAVAVRRRDAVVTQRS
jgi:hypothetical protein